MMFDFSGHMWSCAVWKSFNQLSSWWPLCKRYAYTLIRVSRHYYVIRMFLLCLCIFVSNKAFWSWSWKLTIRPPTNALIYRISRAQASSVLLNYANPVYGVATICHQVRWLRWGHPSLFHTATSFSIWNKMFCVRDISYSLKWMEFINIFSVYAQSGTHSRFNW